MSSPTAQRWYTVAVLLAWVPLQLGLSTADKMEFVKGDALVIANGDGTNPRDLVKDGEPKAHPSWSPDGTRIAYEIAGNSARDQKSYATLIVIDRDGKRVAAVSVLSTLSDGSEVAGMRFVERGGWHSRTTLFAEGSANPYVAEYRVLDIEGRRSPDSVGSQFHFGSQFDSCPARAFS